MRKNIVKFVIAVVVLASLGTLMAMYAFADNDNDSHYLEFTFDELKEKVEQNDGLSLAAFNDKEYDTCYGNQLDEPSKVVYDTMVENIDNTKDGNYNVKITLVGYDWNELNAQSWQFLYYGLAAFDYDYPEVFWINNSGFTFGLSSTGKEINITFKPKSSNYYCNGYSSRADVETDIAKIDQIVANIKSETKVLNTYEKLRYINSYLVDKNEYNRYVSNGNQSAADNKAWKVVSALVYGNTDTTNAINPVCEGYSRAFKLLANNLGIEAVLVSGGYHMWNYVKLYDNKWYAVDVTWNDPVWSGTPSKSDIERYKYKYFLIGSDTIFSDHKEETVDIVYMGISGVNYPEIQKSDYVYNEKDFEVTTESTTVSTTESTTESTTVSTTVPTTEKEILYGDVDNDGVLTINDCVKLLKGVLDGVLTEYEKSVGNVDNNDYIDANDVSEILQKVLDSNFIFSGKH